MSLKILHEDEALLVVNKPAGLPTLSDPDKKTESLAHEILITHPELSSIPEYGIAHRLDNDTSGIICIGKTAVAYDKIRTQFSQGMAKKEYVALVSGTAPESGNIDNPIAHHPKKKKKMVVCESESRASELKGREAHTSFVALKDYTYPHNGESFPYTLLSVSISTGVRHQIRAHMSWIGLPIAGDRLYQNPARRAEDTLPLKRHFLHAGKIELVHPTTGSMISFECELPADLRKILSMLTNISGL